MAKHIFPDSIINFSQEKVISDFRKPNYIIYNIIIILILLFIASLFIIKIEIGVNAQGNIKPIGDRILITSPISGQLSSNNLLENRFVEKGDTLFTIVSQNIDIQLPSLLEKRKEIKEYLNDLNKIISRAGDKIDGLISTIYKQEYHNYLIELEDYKYNESVLKSNLNRNKNLFEKDAISQYEYEQVESDYIKSKNATQIYINQKLSQWKKDKNNYESEERNNNIKIQEILNLSNETVVLSPISGSIQVLENVTDGNYIHSGQKILEISPEGDLIAECYISPKDIGLIQEGLKGRIKVDAFNYNQWGMIDIEIIEVFNDVFLSVASQVPYYKVYCQLENKHLSLKNGYKAQLKKGMTINAKFIVTERTVFQLLYDKMDNWLNPNVSNLQ